MNVGEIQEICVERLRISCQTLVTNEVIEHADVTVAVAHAIDSLRFQMDSYVAALPDKTISIHEQWPVTWWDAFKERWFPTWLRKRYPVQYNNIDIEERTFKAICPHIDMPRGRHVHFMLQYGKDTNGND